MPFERYDTEAAMLRGRSVRDQREHFLKEPPALREQTRERVRRTLRAEKARRQNVPSYLMQHAAAIYDVDVRAL
jgi:hypothetical protein